MGREHDKGRRSWICRGNWEEEAGMSSISSFTLEVDIVLIFELWWLTLDFDSEEAWPSNWIFSIYYGHMPKQCWAFCILSKGCPALESKMFMDFC